MKVHSGSSSGSKGKALSRKVSIGSGGIPEKHGGKRNSKKSKGWELGKAQGHAGGHGFDPKKPDREECMMALESAAKYICNLLDGLCPMVVEDFPCPVTCDLETLPWHCWINFFLAGGKWTERKARENTANDAQAIAKV